MNKFGGYEWVDNEKSGCYMAPFEKLSSNAYSRVVSELTGEIVKSYPMLCKSLFK